MRGKGEVVHTSGRSVMSIASRTPTRPKFASIWKGGEGPEYMPASPCGGMWLVIVDMYI